MKMVLMADENDGFGYFQRTHDPVYLRDSKTWDILSHDNSSCLSIRLSWFAPSAYTNFVRWEVTVQENGYEAVTKSVSDQNNGAYRNNITDGMLFQTHGVPVSIYVRRISDHAEDTLNENAYLIDAMVDMS